MGKYSVTEQDELLECPVEDRAVQDHGENPPTPGGAQPGFVSFHPTLIYCNGSVSADTLVLGWDVDVISGMGERGPSCLTFSRAKLCFTIKTRANLINFTATSSRYKNITLPGVLAFCLLGLEPARNLSLTQSHGLNISHSQCSSEKWCGFVFFHTLPDPLSPSGPAQLSVSKVNIWKCQEALSCRTVPRRRC